MRNGQLRRRNGILHERAIATCMSDDELLRYSPHCNSYTTTTSTRVVYKFMQSTGGSSRPTSIDAGGSLKRQARLEAPARLPTANQGWVSSTL